MVYYAPGHHLSKKSPRKRWYWIVAVTSLVAIIALVLFLMGNHQKTPASTPVTQSQSTTTSIDKQPSEPPPPASIDLQPTIDAWLAEQTATYGIVVYDPAAKKVMGSHLPEKTFFAASLYKLFVAYLALEDIQHKKQTDNAILISGHTRLQCIDKMIRESHSPCGEAMIADMGPASLETRLKHMGVQHTTFNSIQTTAKDTALVLQYIIEKRHLDETRTAFLRDAMRTQPQKYKNGLAKGAPNATVDSKVGWNETSNYHDVGIFVLPDQREYIIAILSQGNGSSKPIANFGEVIYARLLKKS